jgi:hypothetical protein
VDFVREKAVAGGDGFFAVFSGVFEGFRENVVCRMWFFVVRSWWNAW